jgi:xanthine dehydrogenase accessory factor
LVENYTACPRLIIIGAGHVGLALSQMGALVGFEVVVFDDRPVFASAERFPAATQVICDSFDHLFERLRIRSSDYVVVVTRGHLHDTACLRDILAGPEPAYTGMIGSRRRVAIVMNGLRGEDYNTERIARIHAPIGLSIGAVTPAEIAVSIVAEVVRVRRQGHSGSTGSVGSVGASGAIASGANGSKGGTGSDLLSCDLEVAQHLASGGRADAMITIFDSSGSVPIDSGAKLSMTYEGAICGTIGGGCSESGAMQEARRLINQGGWRVHTVDMRDSAEEDGMVCGGEMQVIIEKL